MSILWCGGEDIDFPGGGGLVAVDTTAGQFRAGYARCSIAPVNSGSALTSPAFAAGAVTSVWLSCRAYPFQNGGGNGGVIGLSSLNSQSGIYAGFSTSSNSRLGLFTWNVTTSTMTQLAQEAGTSMNIGSLNRLDMQVINYGASGTINLYWNGALLITFTGNIAVSGVTALSQVTILKPGTVNSWLVSEIIVASENTQTFSLGTLVPNAPGFAQQWTGTFANVDEVTINDATPVYTNVAAQNEAFALNALPTGTFVIRAIKATARTSVTAGAAVSNVAVGVYSESTLAPGTAVAQTSAWTTNENLMTTNPVTGATWTQADANALQINLQSS